MKTKTKLILSGVVVGGVVLYRANAAAKKFITKTINPTSTENFVYNATGANENQEVMKSNDLFFANLILLNPFASSEAKEAARNLKKTFYGEYADTEEKLIKEAS